MRSQEVVDRALAAAPPGCHLAALVTESSQVNLRWAVNQLTTNGDTEARQVSIVAMHGAGGSATVSGRVEIDSDVTAMVERAVTAAEAATPAPDAAELVDGGVSRDWDAPVDRSPAGILSALSTGLGAAFRRAVADGVEHFGYGERDLTTTFLGTSAGTRLRHEQAQGRIEFTAKSHERSRSAWIGSSDSQMALDVDSIDARLRASLAQQDRRLSVAPGRHTVLLSPSAVADLMIELYWSSDAQSAVDGRSVFSAPGGTTRVGQRLGAGVNLWSDPRSTGPAMACTAFETAVSSSDASSPYDNGLPLERTDWIADGELRHLVSTRYSARQAGLPATPGIDNLLLSAPGAGGTLADVIARVDDGLLITCLWYNRVVDPQTLLITGLTRDGVYVIKSGEIVGTSGNFRFNESPVSLLGRIVDAGIEERTLAREMGDYFNRAMMPSLVVAEFNLSTASEAL